MYSNEKMEDANYFHYRKTMKKKTISEMIIDWLGDKRFHASHRANLLRKDFEWYSQFGWTENLESPYLWKDSSGWYEQPTGQKNRYYL